LPRFARNGVPRSVRPAGILDTPPCCQEPARCLFRYGTPKASSPSSWGAAPHVAPVIGAVACITPVMGTQRLLGPASNYLRRASPSAQSFLWEHSRFLFWNSRLFNVRRLQLPDYVIPFASSVSPTLRQFPFQAPTRPSHALSFQQPHAVVRARNRSMVPQSDSFFNYAT